MSPRSNLSYTAFAQDPDSGFWLFVRSSRPEEAVLAEMTAAVHDLMV